MDYTDYMLMIDLGQELNMVTTDQVDVDKNELLYITTYS